MAPGGVIGAATPIMGTGQEMPESVEEKITSGIRGLVRAAAEEHGHNTAVFDAMVDRDQGLSIGGKEIVPKGKILTLTAKEALMTVGQPPAPLLSRGTVGSLDELIGQLGWTTAERITVEQTGFETLARWIVKIAPILLLCGVVGVYVEFKTPGFGVPGIAGGICFLIFFFGHYVAGLSGYEVLAVFVLGAALLVAEFLFFPGTVILAASGVMTMLLALVVAMADMYPSDPVLPGIEQLKLPMLNMLAAGAGATVVIGLLARYLPESRLLSAVILSTQVVGEPPEDRSRIGEIGVTRTPLRPSGKALFGESLQDVITAGEMLPSGTQVRIVAVEGSKIVVRASAK